MSHDSYLSRSFPSYIDALLIVVYSAGAGGVSKGNHRQRKASLYSIDIQVNVVGSFSCIWH